MKIVLIAEREELKPLILTHFKPSTSEVIQYWNPIKAMDNIDEIDPDVVLFSARDFPRHWKAFLTFLRGSRSKDHTVFILLKGDEFSFEEASKAQHLGVNGLIHENLENEREIHRLRDLVVRYKEIAEARKEKRYIPGSVDQIDFLFSHPVTLQLVTGTVKDISATGLRFAPDNPLLTRELAPQTRVDAASLRVGQEVISVSCKVIRAKDTVSFSFPDLSDTQREIVNSYLKQHAERELKRVSSL